MRLLSAAKIKYETVEYSWDESDLSGVHIANELGVAPEQVFKTLVTKGEKNGYAVFCIPVDKELDLKKCAVAAKDKTAAEAALKNASSVIESACSKGVYHKNNAARKVSRLAKLVNGIA